MNVTSIVDFSSTHLEIINDGRTLYIKKAYIEVKLSTTDPRIVDMFWHWYEFNDHQHLFYLDFAIITTPVAANAAALLALIQGYLISQLTVANASETVKGIVEEATQAEINAYTDTGATGAKLFVVPSKLKVWIEQAALTIDAIWHFVSAKLRLFNAAKTFYIAFTTAATVNRSQAFMDADGTIALREQFTTLTAAYTLTSQTAAQKIFNTPTNGAVTLEAKAYFFECVFSLTGMSATSGSFGFALGGTATYTSVQWQSNCTKSGSNTNGQAAVAATANTATANTTLFTNNVNTNGTAFIRGIVRVSGAGTLIPMVSFTTVAGAVTPIVGIDSYFRIWEAGANNVVSEGSWS